MRESGWFDYPSTSSRTANFVVPCGENSEPDDAIDLRFITGELFREFRDVEEMLIVSFWGNDVHFNSCEEAAARTMMYRPVAFFDVKSSVADAENLEVSACSIVACIATKKSPVPMVPLKWSQTSVSCKLSVVGFGTIFKNPWPSPHTEINSGISSPLHTQLITTYNGTQTESWRPSSPRYFSSHGTAARSINNNTSGLSELLQCNSELVPPNIIFVLLSEKIHWSRKRNQSLKHISPVIKWRCWSTTTAPNWELPAPKLRLNVRLHDANYTFHTGFLESRPGRKMLRDRELNVQKEFYQPNGNWCARRWWFLGVPIQASKRRGNYKRPGQKPTKRKVRKAASQGSRSFWMRSDELLWMDPRPFLPNIHPGFCPSHVSRLGDISHLHVEHTAGLEKCVAV